MGTVIKDDFVRRKEFVVLNKYLFLCCLFLNGISINPMLPLLTQNHEPALVSAETDIWTPSEVREDRKRILMQTELARVIAQFPTVEKAEVFINDSGQRRLSTKQPEASASVYVISSSGIKDKDRLAITIAEFVSGANRNMNRGDVRIVINGDLISIPKYPPKLYFSNGQFLQNSLTFTNRPLDLGILGDGYFKLKIYRDIVDENGNLRRKLREEYTRMGRIGIDVEGNLVLDTPHAYFLLMDNKGTKQTHLCRFGIDEDGSYIQDSSKDYFLEPSITFPEGSYNLFLREDGRVLANVNGDREEIGEIMLYRFPNPSDLIKVANHIFIEFEHSGSPIEGTPGDPGFGSLVQGYLETQFLSSDEKDRLITETESTSQQHLKKAASGESQVTLLKHKDSKLQEYLRLVGLIKGDDALITLPNNLATRMAIARFLQDTRTRMNVICQNIANADAYIDFEGTPYRRKLAVYDEKGKLGVEEQNHFRMEYDPKHRFANKDGYKRMPGINPVLENVNLMSAIREYEWAAEILKRFNPSIIQ
jgi:flagellar basal body rod protein FlgC/flagellar basal body rod protein FlgG